MGNTNSIDLSRRITNGSTAGNSIARNDSSFNPVDWDGAMQDAMMSAGMNMDALDYNTRLFRELARQGEAMGLGKNK